MPSTTLNIQRIRGGLSALGLCIVGIIVSQLIITTTQQIHWPAYNTSYVLLAVTTATSWCIFLTLIAVQYILALRRYSRVLSIIGLNALITVLLALPLGATRLYLGGISIDQQFRTEFLTRLTHSWHLSDMTYAQIPPYYPSGWFWFAGRYAALSHLPGWAALKPFSILTLAIAVSISYLWWCFLLESTSPQIESPTSDISSSATRLPYALLFSLAPGLITLPFAQEPYSTALAIIFPAAITALWRGLSQNDSQAKNSHSISCGVYFGACISIYTLYAAVFIWAMIFIGIAIKLQSAKNSIRISAMITTASYILIIGLIIGSIVWLPFCLAIFNDISNISALFASGGANAYLPITGAQLSLPFIELSIPGLLCLMGVLWLIRYFRSTAQATAWAIALISLYLWQIVSCLLTIIGTTLLSFRLNPVIDAILVCAGIYAIPWLFHLTKEYITSPKLIAVLSCLAIACWIQAIPRILGADLDRAYTDTDGYGYRGDKRPPGPERFYPQIAEWIYKNSHIPADKIIILTSEYGFLAVTPFRGFQSLTPHYANPLAHFTYRNQLIISWSKAQNSTEFLTALTQASQTIAVPHIWLFRSDNSPYYHLRLSENVFPNNPNVHRFPVDFSPTLFDPTLWQTNKIGPFTIVTSRAIMPTITYS